MSREVLATEQKAQAINQDKTFFGTFAEIGAGQEVARHFFVAGHASNTIAKTMSAYDKSFSDAIYGKGDRYVSQQRLRKMLDHEYKTLLDRLESNGRCFFTFANTVATSSHDNEFHGHAWMGIRLQCSPQAQPNDIILHIKMHDRLRLQQQEALGIIGVNLIYASNFYRDQPDVLINSLLDNLSADRIEIDYINFSGPSFSHIDNKKMSLELVAQGLTRVVIINEKSEVIESNDYFYGRNLLIHRGAFRPITNVNIEILNSAEKHCKKITGNDLVNIFEFALTTTDNEVDFDDALHRINIINESGYPVLVSNFPLLYQIKNYLRQCTTEHIFFVIGAAFLDKLFDPVFYQKLEGGILTSFGFLFDEKTKLLVFPYKSEMLCTTASTFHPSPDLETLYRYLFDNQYIQDILDCDHVDTSLHSEDVRKMLVAGDESWKKYVPKKVADYIVKHNLFQSR